MKLSRQIPSYSTFIGLFGLLATHVAAEQDVLSTDGFTSCLTNSTIKLSKMNLQFDRKSNMVDFDVAGTSQEVQNVTAVLQIQAYGRQVYQKSFDPCAADTKVDKLCPVPKGYFPATGNWKVPPEWSSAIPSIAYSVPDLAGMAKMELQGKGPDGKVVSLACYESGITNHKTTKMPGISYAAAAIAAAALIASGLSALAGTGSSSGASTSSPTFVEVVHWFQTISMNGMMSVQYPSVYRDFSQNFAFSTGLIPWRSMQVSIDTFRNKTGGNLTFDSVPDLDNSQLVYQQPSNSGLSKRALVSDLAERAVLFARDGVSYGVNGTGGSVGNKAPGGNGTSGGDAKQQKYVSGMEAYAAQLAVPKANTFMTALLIFAIVLAAIAAGILLLKVILEAWAIFGNFPKKLASFRKNYWWLLAKWNTNLILLLYGVWTLYCVYQFKEGDSWAAKILAAVTLTLFTVILLGFTWRIWSMAHKFKKTQGSASFILYDNKETWRKYSIFYDNYKRSYWWLFVPSIIYMFTKGCILAGADQHSLAQTAGMLVVDSLLLILLLVLRPYNLKSGNWINISIQLVRVASVVCILVFVEQLGFSQTTQTITGVVLIVVQAALTGVLGILIAINAIINCVRMNPHRRARKEREKQRDLDALTPLDAHNSLLMYPMVEKEKGQTEVTTHARGRSANGYDMLPLRDESNDRLSVSGKGTSDRFHDRTRSASPASMHQRQPQLPDIEYKGIAI